MSHPASTSPAALEPAEPAAPLTVLSPQLRDAFLNQIPSETSPGERAYLFEYFRRQWDGTGAVVEIGPFLGGTTRAIAWGMACNPRVTAGAALHTFDRFADYYSAERLRATIEPMVRDGVFTAPEATELCRGANFERLFHAIHSPHAYGKLVHLHNSPLPDRAEEIDDTTALDCLADQGELSALFIDGCKSWASTHYAMKFLLPRLRAGAPVIFQDFGWYTCFWISSVAHALREFLTEVEHVDATYVFRLTRRMTEADVVRRFPRTAVEAGEVFFARAAKALDTRSRHNHDLRGELIAQLHHVAALMTIGRRGAAVDLLKSLDVKRYAAFADMIRGCLKSPTYLPGGKAILWREAA
ncbi:MAG TPA: class I SAM-dependent methyltransferase [Lacunisphaera sp.]|nr:class I SAM-dependent methyltransferase [Lacunisphaera sp.]